MHRGLDKKRKKKSQIFAKKFREKIGFHHPIFDYAFFNYTNMIKEKCLLEVIHLNLVRARQDI